MKLWEIGMQWHQAVNADDLWDCRWCKKHQKSLKYADLSKLKCWECPQYLMNEGECNPI